MFIISFSSACISIGYILKAIISKFIKKKIKRIEKSNLILVTMFY